MLDKIGNYKQGLHILYAAKPSAAELKNTLSLSEKLGRLSGVFFDKENLSLSETRLGLTSSKDPSASFEIDSTTGNFLFNGGMRNYRKEAPTAGLPMTEQAVELSTKVLQGSISPLIPAK